MKKLKELSVKIDLNDWIMTQNNMQSNLQNIYSTLQKKDKGLILQAIISHENFSQSKEWLKKYMVGAYNKINESVEIIGIEIVEQLGFNKDFSESNPTFHFDTPVEDKTFVKSNDYILGEIRLQNLKVNEIYEIYQNNTSASELAIAWVRFGWLCRSIILNKVNPFKKAAELDKIISQQNSNPTILPELLLTLYQQGFSESKESGYMSIWLLFGQVSRYNFSINPFCAIKYINLSQPIINHKNYESNRIRRTFRRRITCFGNRTLFTNAKK